MRQLGRFEATRLTSSLVLIIRHNQGGIRQGGVDAEIHIRGASEIAVAADVVRQIGTQLHDVRDGKAEFGDRESEDLIAENERGWVRVVVDIGLEVECLEDGFGGCGEF